MHPICMRLLAASIAAVMMAFASNPTLAQNGEQKAGDKPQAPDAKEVQKKADDLAQVGKALVGPAANPECVWVGRRVVSLLWRDDLDTAFRHLDVYDRFGCPAGHIQAAFRCVVRQGKIDEKATDTLNSRVDACWLNPASEPQGTAAVPSATTNR